MNTIKDTIATIKNIPTKEKLESILLEKTVLVEYRKLDGDVRMMSLTKNLKSIPVTHHPKEVKEPHEKNITGWCEEADGWRSFRYDNLIKVDQDESNVILHIGTSLIQQEIDKEIIDSLGLKK